MLGSGAEVVVDRDVEENSGISELILRLRVGFDGVGVGVDKEFATADVGA